jgi:hypothetical protein
MTPQALLHLAERAHAIGAVEGPWWSVPGARISPEALLVRDDDGYQIRVVGLCVDGAERHIGRWEYAMPLGLFQDCLTWAGTNGHVAVAFHNHRFDHLDWAMIEHIRHRVAPGVAFVAQSDLVNDRCAVSRA